MSSRCVSWCLVALLALLVRLIFASASAIFICGIILYLCLPFAIAFCNRRLAAEISATISQALYVWFAYNLWEATHDRLSDGEHLALTLNEPPPEYVNRETFERWFGGCWGGMSVSFGKPFSAVSKPILATQGLLCSML